MVLTDDIQQTAVAKQLELSQANVTDQLMKLHKQSKQTKKQTDRQTVRQKTMRDRKKRETALTWEGEALSGETQLHNHTHARTHARTHACTQLIGVC